MMRELREHWKTTTLGDHVEVQTGYPFKSQVYTDKPTGVRLLRGDNIIQGCLRWDGVKRWPSDDIQDYTKYFLAAGDVVVAMDRPWIEAGLKYACINDLDLPCLLVQRVARLRGKNGLRTDYLRYLIGHQAFTDYVKGIWTGVAVPHISESQIRAFRFNLPSIAVQDRIAGVLSAYDDLLENNTRRIKILEEMARMIYREWFINFRFPGHENVKVKSIEGRRVPDGWQVKNLFDLAEVTYGFPFKSKLFSAEKLGIPVVRIRDIVSSSTDTFTTESADEKYLLRNGDLLVGMDGNFHMGKWSGGRAYQNQRVVRFRPKGNLSPYFLFLAIQEPIRHFDSTIVGTTVAHLSDRDLRSVEVLIPDDELLRATASILNPCFDLEINLALKNSNLRTTRDLLLPRLVSGEVSVEALDVETAAQVS